MDDATFLAHLEVVRVKLFDAITESLAKLSGLIDAQLLQYEGIFTKHADKIERQLTREIQRLEDRIARLEATRRVQSAAPTEVN